MITGEIKGQVDRVWDSFWTGGISNPMEVVEQLTYLLFIKRLDEIHTLREKKANALKKPIQDPIFPEGKTSNGRSFQDLRWSRFKNFEAGEMYKVITEDVFPFMKGIGGKDDTTFNANQIHFINFVVDYLTKNGLMEPELLYEPPFTDLHHEGVAGMFGDTQATELIGLIRRVSQTIAVN